MQDWRHHKGLEIYIFKKSRKTRSNNRQGSLALLNNNRPDETKDGAIHEEVNVGNTAGKIVTRDKHRLATRRGNAGVKYTGRGR